MTKTRKRPMGVLMVIENNGFPDDVRVRAEAAALAAAGYRVSVVCPRRAGQPLHSREGAIEVFRYPAPPEASRFVGYIWEYGYSVVATLVVSVVVAVRSGFDVIHVANPPDLFFVLAWLYRPFGKRFVFDHHDLAPEMYRARFGPSASSVLERILRLMERWSFQVADLVISTNASYKRIAIERGRVPPDRVAVVRNGPDLARVRPEEPDTSLRHLGSTILGYVGVMGPQDGVDLLLRAAAHLVHQMGRDVAVVLVGDGDQLPTLRKLAQELRIEGRVRFAGHLGSIDVMRQLSTADICVDPDPSNPYNDASSMIKMSEYMALGKPIVAFDLPEHRVTAGDAALYATPNRPDDLAHHIATLIDQPDLAEELGTRGRRAVEDRLGWHRQAPILIQAYRQILESHSGLRNPGAECPKPDR